MYIIYVTLFSITIKQILLYVHHKTDLSPQNSIATDFFLMQNKSILKVTFGALDIVYLGSSLVDPLSSTVHLPVTPMQKDYDVLPMTRNPPGRDRTVLLLRLG